MEEELGDLVFAVVNLARHLDIDPEKALTSANRKFERRFRDMEGEITGSGKRLKDYKLTALDKFWRNAKKRVG
jgi:ATP diphosphatase